MIILAVYNTEDILELSSNRICGGFFCNQIVLLLLLQYSTGDSFFFSFLAFQLFSVSHPVGKAWVRDDEGVFGSGLFACWQY